MGGAQKKNTTLPIAIVQTQAETHIEGRLAEKAKSIQIPTLEIPIVAQRYIIFERLLEKYGGPKVWVDHNLKRLIDAIVAGKAIAHNPRDLAKKSLGEHNGSLFTQWSSPSKEIFHAEIQHLQR